MKLLPKAFLRTCAIAIALLCSQTPAIAEIQTIPLPSLPQNSRLAVWGDSITELTLSSRYIEIYLLACAGRKDVKVCTFGHSGETLSGIISRQTDLEFFKPTIVSINYGMNDTQYSPYTNEKGATFDKTMRDVIAMLDGKGIKQHVIIGPGLVDDTFTRADFFRGADPGGISVVQAQNITLGHLRDFARAAAVDTHSAYADIHNRMQESYELAKKTYGPKYDFAGPGGGVHPAANGHLMMTCEILKALACDGDIGTIDVDMKGAAHASDGHKVISFADGVVTLDSSKYPFCYNYDSFTSKDPDSMASILPYLPFSQDLNRLMLKVTNLGTATANITWGSETKSFTAEQLAKGINLAAEFSHTPFDATFAQVMNAVGDKQTFENFMIKGTSNYFGNDNGGNVDDNMIAVQEQKDTAVKALIVPVRHTIAITLPGATPPAITQAPAPAPAPAPPPPVVTAPATMTATVGAPFSYQIVASNSPTDYFVTCQSDKGIAPPASSLPPGLTYDTKTGILSGTPKTPGTFTVQVAAMNDGGIAASLIKLTIAP